MSVDRRTAIDLPAPGADRLSSLDRTAATPGAEREKLADLAAQFESMLMLEMIKQMRRSLLDEGSEGEGLGNETYSSTIDSELATHLAKAGGMGLTPMLVDAWDRRSAPAVAPGSAAVGTVADTASGASSGSVALLTPASSVVSAGRQVAPTPTDDRDIAGTAISLDMQARVSSAYGWRTDPFRGTQKFHGGIDLAARYGTEVPAAAAGTVVTAGEQGAYGLTVVIRHPNGYESRYAHLSSLEVKAGDAVGQGQHVGRVGSTGRSTAPHLHFEVTQAGQRVDPERFVRNLTSDIKGQ